MNEGEMGWFLVEFIFSTTHTHNYIYWNLKNHKRQKQNGEESQIVCSLTYRLWASSHARQFYVGEVIQC